MMPFKSICKQLLIGTVMTGFLAQSAQANCIQAFLTGFDEYQRGETTSKAVFRVNELLVLCFQASSAGFVSVFDAPKQGSFEQLYPNMLTHPNGETHTKIEAGKRYCFGGADTFPMYHPANEGIGVGKVSITLTRSSAAQLAADDYAIPGQKVTKSTMDLHLSNHSRAAPACTERDVVYLEYRVTN